MDTSVCEEVGGDNPISRIEAVEGVCNGDKCCADDRSLNCGKKKGNPKPAGCY